MTESEREEPELQYINVNLKRVVVEKKLAVRAVGCVINRFSLLFYFLIWVLPPVPAGLLPTLRTGTLDTGILVRGASL